jgi:hypothetical protein
METLHDSEVGQSPNPHLQTGNPQTEMGMQRKKFPLEESPIQKRLSNHLGINTYT